MPAEFREEFLTPAELPVHIIFLNRAPGTFDSLLPSGEYKNRMIAVLPDSSGNNARQTLMNSGQINHQDFLPHAALPDSLHCQLHALRRHRLPLQIQFDQLLRNRRRTGRILREKQAKRDFCGLQPPARVDTGAQHKSDVIRADLPGFQPVFIDQRPHTRIFRAVDAS